MRKRRKMYFRMRLSSAFKNLERYRGDSTFGAWLKRIVINKAINSVSRRKPERMPEDDRWDVKEEEETDLLAGFPFTGREE
ncbi:MAG: sigma factor [Cytophagales bacterium]|nr:sigma factor [Cytophagales bacterium]